MNIRRKQQLGLKEREAEQSKSNHCQEVGRWLMMASYFVATRGLARTASVRKWLVRILFFRILGIVAGRTSNKQDPDWLVATRSPARMVCISI